MALLGLLLVLLLQVQAGISGESISGQIIRLYNKPGDEAVLPCNIYSSSGPCYGVEWLYNRGGGPDNLEVRNGNVNKISARASRLRVNSDCSLIINNITAGDFGQYTCRFENNPENDPDLATAVFLSILTISPSPPDADQKDEEVTLTCSLMRFRDFGRCKDNSIRWVDEEGRQLLGKGVGYEFRGQRDCVSSLAVKHQKDHSRRFTCQFVEGDDVKIEAHYSSLPTDAESPVSPQIIVGSAVGGVMLLFIIAAVLITYRRRSKVTEEEITTNVQTPTDQDANPPDVHYASISHSSISNTRVHGHEDYKVTYSTVGAAVPDPSSLYASV